jgi:GxxExxY protein
VGESAPQSKGVLGPGLLESADEERLTRELASRGNAFERREMLPSTYKDVELECGYRIDLLVDGRVVNLKAVDALPPIHDAIVLTYPRLSGCPIGP